MVEKEPSSTTMDVATLLSFAQSPIATRDLHAAYEIAQVFERDLTSKKHQ